MYVTTGKTRMAGVLPAMAAGILCVTAALPANAETVKTVNGVPIDSAVLDFYIQSRTQRPANQVTPEQREAMLDQLTDIYLLTTQEAAAEVRQDPRVQAQIELQSRGVVAQAIAGQFFAEATVTEEEIQAAYEEQTSAEAPLQFKARHILLESQGQAADVIAELDDGGDFAEIAREKSTGPSGSSGGDLGWFSAEQMVKPFSDAVAGLEDGAYTSEPVKTDFGWHVILREDSRASEPPPLESLRPQLEQYVKQQKFADYVESLRGSDPS